jgi:hypothetical protein
MSSGAKKLVYYDGNGSRHTNLVAEPLLAKILQLFDGTLRSVSRSTGGLGLAMPNGIKFDVKDDAPITTPDEIFIQLSCFEFEANLTTPEKAFSIRPKLLPISQVLDCFSFSDQPDQKYVVDFGAGIIPVWVIKFVKTQSGQEMALFVDGLEAQRILQASEPFPKSIQSFWIPRECLRSARSPEQGCRDFDEYELAQIHYRKFSESGARIYPKLLKLGQRLPLSPNITIEKLHKMVVDMYGQHTGRTQVLNSTLVLSSEGLIPFGMFEGTASMIRVKS